MTPPPTFLPPLVLPTAPTTRPSKCRLHAPTLPPRWRAAASPAKKQKGGDKPPRDKPDDLSAPIADMADLTDDLLVDDLLADNPIPPKPPVPSDPNSSPLMDADVGDTESLIASPSSGLTDHASSTDESPNPESELKPENKSEKDPQPEQQPQPDLQPEAKMESTSTPEEKSTVDTPEPQATEAAQPDKEPLSPPVPEKSAPPEQDASSEPPESKLQLTPEQIANARAAREAAEAASDKSREAVAARNKKIRETVESTLEKIGTKSKAFDFGEKARARAESYVDEVIEAGKGEKVEQQDKLKATAVTTARSVVGKVTTIWEDKVMPFAKQNLPEDVSDISSRALASTTIGLFLAVLLFQPFFGGGKKVKTLEAKKIDAETARLEKKLNRDRASSTYSSRSSSQKAVFPDETSSPVGKTSTKIAGAPKPAPTPTPTPPAQVEPSAPPASVLAPPAPRPPAPKPQPERIALKDVTPELVLSTTTKALGSNSNLVLAASFDSLYAEPTVVLQVSKAFHKLPAGEQRIIAATALQACRTLGYERVTLLESGTDVQVAQAGIDIDLEDETENLRAEVDSMKKLADKLALKSAADEAEITRLLSRLDEERYQFAGRRTELEQTITGLRSENAAMADDLSDARNEIARMPDRLELEQRTIEAEKITEKLQDTTEMLSAQVTTARNAEAKARQTSADSETAMNKAIAERDEALNSVAGRIASNEKDAQARADAAIAQSKKEAETAMSEAEATVKATEERAAAAQKESTLILEQKTAEFEKQINEEKTGREKEVNSVTNKYEAMLEDMGKKAKAELEALKKASEKEFSDAAKEAKATQTTLAKERDQAKRETEKAEEKAQKAADKAAREREGLEKKIAQLQAKLKGKAAPETSESGEVKSEAAVGSS